MILVNKTVSENFSGEPRNPGAITVTMAGENMMPNTQNSPTAITINVNVIRTSRFASSPLPEPRRQRCISGAVSGSPATFSGFAATSTDADGTVQQYQWSIDGTVVPKVLFKSASVVKLMGGAALKALVPKGTPVCLEVTNPDGGSSDCFTYTR